MLRFDQKLVRRHFNIGLHSLFAFFVEAEQPGVYVNCPLCSTIIDRYCKTKKPRAIRLRLWEGDYLAKGHYVVLRRSGNGHYLHYSFSRKNKGRIKGKFLFFWYNLPRWLQSILADGKPHVFTFRVTKWQEKQENIGSA